MDIPTTPIPKAPQIPSAPITPQPLPAIPPIISRPTTPLSPLPIAPPSPNPTNTPMSAPPVKPPLPLIAFSSPIIPQPQKPQVPTPKLATPQIPSAPIAPLSIPDTQPIDLSAMDFSENQETLKYSIHTMAQDLERAQKEDVLPDSAIKSPTAPPPPPALPIVPTRKIATAPTISTSSTDRLQVPPFIRADTKPAMPIKPATMPTLKQGVSLESPPSTLKAYLMPTLKPSPMPTKTISPVPTFMPTITAPQTPTLKPLAPIARPSAIPPPIKKLSRLSFPQLNLAIGILGVVIVLLGSVGFSYWWFFVREAPIKPVIEEPAKPQEPITPLEPTKPIEILEPTTPPTIVFTDSDIVIETDIKIASPEMLPSLISKISLSSREKLENKNLGRILIKYTTKTEKSYLTFQEVIDLLQIKIPNNIIQNAQNGEILAYEQNGTIRYGLAIKIMGDSLSMLNYMNFWENTAIDDIKNLYIENLPVILENSVFKDNFHESFVKSYINLPDTETSLDWAISNEKQILIIATSKDMTYKIMDSFSTVNSLP